MPDILDFGEPEKENSIIKVIGVGGGGGNAVNHMYREGIHLSICNLARKVLVQEINLKRHAKLQKRLLMISSSCSWMELKWHSSQQEWEVALVLVQHLS